MYYAKIKLIRLFCLFDLLYENLQKIPRFFIERKGKTLIKYI